MLRFKTLGIAVLLVALLSAYGVIGWADQEQPRYGGTFIMPETYSAHISMDPIRIGSERAEDIQVIFQAFEGLIKLDLPTLKIVPAVASLPDVSDDLLMYTFHLRHGVKFHNGREVIASDFIYSFERLMNPDEAAIPINILENVVGVDAYKAGTADHISGLKMIDDYTLTITLSNVDVDFLYKLAEPGASVVPQEAVESLGRDFGRTPVSCGPFKFESWIGNEITLVAFEDYYDGRPYLDKLIYRTMLEPGTRGAAFEAEEIDATRLTSPQYLKYRNDPLYKDYLIEVAELWTRNLYFNTREGPFVDKKVRQAFNYAIDNKIIIEKFLLGMAFPCVGYLPNSLPTYNPELVGYDYNPELAKELLKAAGYENGVSVEIIGDSTSPTWGIPYVEAAVPYLEAVGFKVTLVPLESAARHTRRNTGEHDAGMTSTGGSVSPLSYMSRYLSQRSRAEGNFPAYFNPRFDHYLDLAGKETNFEKRMELIRKAEEIFVDDSPIWFANYSKGVMVYQPWVHGLESVALDLSYQPMAAVWVDETSPRAK